MKSIARMEPSSTREFILITPIPFFFISFFLGNLIVGDYGQ